MADDYATWRPQAEQDWTDEDVERLRQELATATAHTDRLRSALKRYGRHEHRCAHLASEWLACTCGLDAALRTAAMKEGEAK